jgi:hypothetical protein
MNPQEYGALRDILTQLMEIRGVKKDPEADALIQAAVAQQPDATYLLARHAMLLGVELDRARARIALLVSEAQRGRSDYVDFGTARGRRASIPRRRGNPDPSWWRIRRSDISSRHR